MNVRKISHANLASKPVTRVEIEAINRRHRRKTVNSINTSISTTEISSYVSFYGNVMRINKLIGFSSYQPRGGGAFASAKKQIVYQIKA